jgi:putative ABC transport system permease protein
MSASIGGGFAARRAVVRWAWRLLRRDWRQQILVLVLLTVAVAAAVTGAAAVYNVAPSANGEFGGANVRIEFDGRDPRALAAGVTAARRQFGTIDVIAHRSAPIPGSADNVDLRAQDPHGPYSGPMLRLRAGRYPVARDEVAVTDGVAAMFQAGVGATFALDGHRRTVVGMVENPGFLGDEFVLVPPAHADPPMVASILVRGSAEQAAAVAQGDGGSYELRRDSAKAGGTVGVFAVDTVFLLLVALVAAAGFVVMAQRRMRQLGVLTAVGATDRHLRLVMVANGIVVGAVAAVAGVVVGLMGWFALAPHLEAAAAHRIDRLDVPWWLISGSMLLAVVTATAAAWWPARAISRIPATSALSGRPPRPVPAHRSALLAALLIAIGLGCLARARQTNALLIVAGTLATALGVLFISPAAVRALAPAARPFPVAVRLALRDLARYQARSGAALSAITLGLGIAVATIITTTAAKDTAAEGNLSDRQLVIRVGSTGPDAPVVGEWSSAELGRLRAQVDRFAATLHRPGVVALDVAVDPAVRESGEGKILRPFAFLGRRVGPHTYRDAGILYVATPELLRQIGVDPASVDPDADILTGQTGDLSIVNMGNGQAPPPAIRHLQRIHVAAYTSAPASFITAAGLRQDGWRQARSGWLIETDRPFTSAQLAAARDMAAGAGMTVEARHDEASLSAIRSGATVVGMLLALGALAMTVGLIRGESAGDLRTLTAAGATGTIRRTLTAATAGTLALLGVLLGTSGAYLALIAGYANDLGTLGRIPVPHLASTLIGVPLAAIAGGWLLAGREPPALARQPIE